MPDLFGVTTEPPELANATTVSDIFKALDDVTTQEQMKAAQPAEEPQSYFIDPFNILNYVGPKAKPGPVSYAILQHMAGVPAIAAIINTRINQIVNFTRPSRRENPGFRITPRDPDAQVNSKNKQEIQRIEDFFLRTGWVRNKRRKDNFTAFMKKWGRDTLRYDEVTAEIVEGMNARQYPISEIWAMDPATIEIVLHDRVNEEEPIVYEPETKRGREEGGKNIAYVQRIQGQIKTEYTEEQLIRAHRNPRTDIDYANFGYSELEQLISIVTGIMNAMHYNTSYFSMSNLPQGVLEIVGKYQPEHLEGFKRAWQTLVTGSVGKQWKVPVMALEEGQGFKFTQLKQGNRDMEYSQFMQFLHNVACAVYQIDPEEVGFKAWDSGGQNQLSNNDAPATTINHSKDKGFRPLMHFFEDVFNHYILDRIAPDYRFEWVGIDIDRAAQQWAQEKDMLAEGVMTPRMYWDKHDIDYKQYGYDQATWIDMPPNQTLGPAAQQDIAHQQQMEQAEQQHQQNMESTLVQGIQQTGLAKQQQEHQMQQQYMQGIQQAGLQGQKDQAQQGMQQADQQHQMNMADRQHEQQLQQGYMQGVQQSAIESQKHGQAKEMQGIQHQQALRQNMQQHGLGMAAESQKHKNAKDLADHNHTNNMEAQTAQGMQQQGLQSQKHEQGKEMAELQLMHQLEQLIQSGAQQASLSRQNHQQGLRQNFQRQQFTRSNNAQAAKNTENQTRLQHTLNLQAQAQQQKQQPKKRDELKKSLTDDVLEIVIELV